MVRGTLRIKKTEKAGETGQFDNPRQSGLYKSRRRKRKRKRRRLTRSDTCARFLRSGGTGNEASDIRGQFADVRKRSRGCLAGGCGTDIKLNELMHRAIAEQSSFPPLIGSLSSRLPVGVLCQPHAHKACFSTVVRIHSLQAPVAIAWTSPVFAAHCAPRRFGCSQHSR
jgi:hypothetical protein